ncbi:hypothetical protein MXB_1355 [Myxobolus squamalis]|nr:hypothetical protein MXB_1355 [Myxobolus squamalis]
MKLIASLCGHKFSVTELALFKRTLVSVSRDNTIKIWNINSRKIKYVIETKISMKMVSNLVKFSSKDVVLINDQKTGIHVICLKKYHCIHLFSIPECVNFLTYHQFVFTLDVNNEFIIWDLVHRKIITKLIIKNKSFKKSTNTKMSISKGMLILSFSCRDVSTNYFYILDLVKCKNV